MPREIGEILTLQAAHGKTALLDALVRAVEFRQWRAGDVRSILAAAGAAPQPRPPLTEVGVYLGWYKAATRLVHYVSVLAGPFERLKGVRRAVDKETRRIQRSRAGPATEEAIRSDVVAVAGDASGANLSVAHLTGGDPYSFTAPMLAWAAGKAAADSVRPAGALGPVEAFGLGSLETGCADAGFHREAAGLASR